MRVIVAEDDAVSRRILQRAVEKLGHDCAVAADGEAAWQMQDASPADVIISDWLMPGVDGLELCRRVRGKEGGPYTYFLFMTALGDRQHFLRGMEAGADDYLTKPVDLDELKARLIAAARVTSLHRRLMEQNAELERLGQLSFEAARTDPLTHFGNRLRLHEDLEALLGRAQRYGHSYCAALCDVDYFKAYNDRYGHLAGDEALRAIADAIRSQLRSGDRVYRYGGEEFLVILPEQTAEGAAAAMDRVRAAVEALRLEHLGRPDPPIVTLSAGIAALGPIDTTSSDEWLRRADQALYEAKRLGRNRVSVFG